MVKLSIVTITLNDVLTIEQTVQSVLNQNYSNLEYIVIDGGSTDGTLEILNKYKDKFEYFKSSPDNGIYDAMNKGILKASGDFICFVNGGDFLYKDALFRANEVFLTQKTNLFFSVADIDYVDDQNNIVGSKICRSNEQILKKKFIEMPTNHLGIFVPLKTFKEQGLFDTKFKHRADYLFILRLIKKGYKPLNLNKTIGAFRLGGTSGGYATFFENYRPDAVLVIADRFENLSVAISASYLNIPLIHIQGGEVTGSIDEKVRHAITKLSDIHFVATKRSKKFLIKMGENKKNVFLTGCPSIDIAFKAKSKLSKDFFKKNKGVGNVPKYYEKYIVVMHHPETTKFNETYSQILQTINAILKLKDIKIVWLWPNIDAGSDIISKQLRILRENKLASNISFFKNFTPENYIKLIYNSECLVGNSSSGIRESSFLSIPVVNIGSRQKNRERGLNVIDVEYNQNQIFNAILKQMQNRKIKKSFIYGDGFAYKKIVNLLSKIFKKKISVEKQLNYL